MSGGQTSTVTSNSQPPAPFQNALLGVGQKAQNDASVPFQPYTGQLVAGLSPDQQQGISTIQGTQGIAAPYINAAAQEIGNSTAPLAPTIAPYTGAASGLFGQAGSTNLTGAVAPGVSNANGLFNSSANLTPQEIQSFESPYTNQVVNATQAEFNNQNAQQQAGISGNAISQGAFGGDREAVAHGITAGQEQLAQAPVIAGLENQGYTQAEQTALAQNQLRQGAGQGILAGSGQMLSAGQAQGQLQLGAGQGMTSVGGQVLGANEANAWLDSQAGFGLGNLGNEALGTTLQEGNAQLGIGGLEQGQAQQELNVPYQQFLAQQAYPFQTDAWAAGLAGELANAAGGTASTTSPGPSPVSQIAGLATTGLALNQLGAFNGLGSIGSSGGTFGAGTGGTAAMGVSDLSDIAASGESFVARGGAIPHRAGGGGLSALGETPINIPTDSADISIYSPAQAPDVSESVIPPGGGGIASQKSLMGGSAKNGTTNNPNADSTFGTIAKTAGGIAAGIYGGPLGALAANALGSQVHFARGGGLTAFPIQRTRMPGVGGRGLFSNDNMGAEPRRLAAGGVAIPQLPTGGAGITGGNGVNIPMLPTGPVARGPSGGGGGGLASGSVSDYLAQQGAGASHVAPQGYVAPPPPPVAAPPSLSTDQVTQLQDFLKAQQDGQNVAAYQAGNPSGSMARGGGLAMVRRDAGGGLDAADDDMPVPPIPPAGGPPDAPGQGAGIAAGRPSAGAPPSSDDTTGDPKHSPWQALLAAGLGMMSGTSPHALTNIGRGGMEGLQFGEQQKVREEQASLRKLQQQDLAAYRQGMLQNTSNRNETYAQRVQEQTSTDQARASLMMARAAMVGAGHATEGDITAQAVSSLANGKTINPDTQAPWTRADALMHIKGVDARVAQGDRRLDQGDRRLDQGGDRLDLRRQAYQETVQQHGIGNDQKAQAALATKIKGMSDQAIGIYRASKDPVTGAYLMKPEDAQRVAAGFRDNATAAAGAAPAAAAPATPPAGGKPPLSSIFGE